MSLQMNENEVDYLPAQLGALTNLRDLSVRQPLSLLTDRHATNLLQLNANELVALPAEIGNLTNLRRLFVRTPLSCSSTHWTSLTKTK